MTRDEFIHMLEENIKPDAEMNFLVCDYEKRMFAFLKVDDVCMNAVVDDPRNYNSGGIVLTIEKELFK